MSLTPIFSLRTPEVYQALETSPQGLSTPEVDARWSLYGKNLLAEPIRTPRWQRIFVQAHHPFTILLVLAGLITLWQGEYTLTVVIWLTAIANGIFSFWRERQAEQAIEKLSQLLPSFAHVIRNGSETHVPASEIVPGDLLVLAEGDNIPADARVVEEYGLRVNNASLTGEAVPTRKTADASFQTGMSEVERPNLIFAGTSVASGTGRAIVYATGMTTQFGRIAHLTQSVPIIPSPFQKELEHLSKILMWVAIAAGVIVFIIGTYDPQVSKHIPKPLILALGIIAAITPEGLPATLTLSLAMAVQRLTRKGVLAKRLSIVETLGNVSVICTDKSGTLTQNQMTVREVWVAQQRLSLSGVGYEPKGKFSPSPNSQPFEEDLQILMEAALCCNNARLSSPTSDHPQWTSLGDQTEAALKVSALKFGLNEAANEIYYPRVHEIPFDARRKRMTTIHRDWNREVAFIKGAPREVLQLCTHIQLHGEHLPLDESLRNEILSTNDEYARRALRVLALARRDLMPRSMPYTPENIERDLTFLGLIAMMDPPRLEVEKAVQVCRQAGIRIVMITGDYGLTAESLARRVGLITTSNPLIVTGSELDGMDDTSIDQLLDREILFARMAPEHKLRLVASFQRRGEVVAVTGDGVNDAPALRKADVGISMGIIGTDVAKEAADIILTNDNFGAIVAAIEEGRAVYDNIRKFIAYIFSSNVPEVMPFLATAMLGIPQALNVYQILAIDMGTDIVPAVALGTEKPEPDVMEHPPRKRHQPLLERGLLMRSFLWLGLIESILCFTGFLTVYLLSGNVALLNLPFLTRFDFPILFPFITPENVGAIARTVFFASAVTAQIGNALACRTSTTHVSQMGWGSNRLLWVGIGLELAVLAALVYIESLAKLFGHEPLPLQYWVVLLLNALVLYMFEWLRKAAVRKRDKL